MFNLTPHKHDLENSNQFQQLCDLLNKVCSNNDTAFHSMSVESKDNFFDRDDRSS